MNDFDAEQHDLLRMKEQTVTLTNQQIIQLAYAYRERIEPILDAGGFGTFDANNCYLAIKALVFRLLEVVDSDYLKQHKPIAALDITSPRKGLWLLTDNEEPT